MQAEKGGRSVSEVPFKAVDEWSICAQSLPMRRSVPTPKLVFTTGGKGGDSQTRTPKFRTAHMLYSKYGRDYAPGGNERGRPTLHHSPHHSGLQPSDLICGGRHAMVEGCVGREIRPTRYAPGNDGLQNQRTGLLQGTSTGDQRRRVYRPQRCSSGKFICER